VAARPPIAPLAAKVAAAASKIVFMNVISDPPC
jgi:hypothetical protein